MTNDVIDDKIPDDEQTRNLTSSGAGSYSLHFSKISYEVQANKEDKMLLYPVSGLINPGEMLCIMGQSGAGKSTLLDILAARIAPSHQLKGSLKLNGEPIDSKTFKRVSGYVMQADALYPLLTVRETLAYAASFRIANKTHKEKQRIVDATLATLKLTGVQNTIVGDELNRGISGGEKRRVSIGVDTIHQPHLIFLDEPTSGLDSATALSIIRTLKEMCVAGNRTVVMTIHQPSMKIFNCFDNALFLAKGHTVYHGTVANLADWIPQSGLATEIPRFTNLPEFFLEVIEEFAEEGKLDQMLQLISNSDLETGLDNSQHGVIANLEEQQIEFANDFLTEVLLIAKRNLQNTLRTKELFYARMGLSLLMGTVMGTLYFNADTESFEGIREITSYLIFVIVFFYFTSMEALPIFLNERCIFVREASRGAYRISSYALAGTITYFPFTLFFSVILTTVSWFLIGLPANGNVFMFQVFNLMSTCFNGNCFATLVSGIAPDAITGNAMGAGALAKFFLFCGFFIPKSEIPPWWIWLHYISPFKYSYESIALNLFNHLDTEPADFELQRLDLEGSENKW
eukprot:CAMPEP_0117741362 /NCGR_PEP_ID=MMETSP0947-20121206/4872_1 /TAXON_ID=44440 /ORGANISM="Chattonella subsalsa, Strain CCMP2191" /LENGTH=571 /DNA_ID=CAMNT_0005557613 /DNA_START=386 /DNA_END=2098 /DNA_ORIENTATION=+